MQTPTTIGTAVMEAVGILREAGVDTPRLDAEILMAFLFGIDRLRLVVESDRHLTEEELVKFRELIAARARRVPLAYLTGEREFYGLSFKITPGVLVPRPETEILVETAVSALRERSGSVRILDVGSGSGCVAVSLAKSLPQARVTAIDPDPTAVSLTAENARRLSVAHQIQVIASDLINLASQITSHRFDAVVSNPPYIPTDDIDSLQPEVSLYEPRGALDGGRDGLDVIRQFISHSPTMLETGGFLALEIGAGQADAVVESGRQSGFLRIRVFPDLAGIPRVVMMAAETRVLAADSDAIHQAVDAIQRSEPVAFPTETIYGLGVRSTDVTGISRIYEAKGRDERKPIALLISDPSQIESLAEYVPPIARRLMKEYFPGPLTIILKAKERVPVAVTAGTGKVGIRMPDHPVALDLISAVGEPLAATSANRSGGPEPESAADVLEQIGGRIELLLDGGPAEGGVPSTVVDLTESPPRILREGAISREDIERHDYQRS